MLSRKKKKKKLQHQKCKINDLHYSLYLIFFFLKKNKIIFRKEGVLYVETRGWFRTSWEQKWASLVGTRLYYSNSKDSESSTISTQLTSIKKLFSFFKKKENKNNDQFFYNNQY